MIKDEEIKMINEKLDYYMLKASDEESDVEDVLKLIKRLDELEPISLPWESVRSEITAVYTVITKHRISRL